MAGVEVGQLDAVVEEDAVAQPLEPGDHEDLALGASGHAGQVDDGAHPRADLQSKLLALVTSEWMGVPLRHGGRILGSGGTPGVHLEHPQHRGVVDLGHR